MSVGQRASNCAEAQEDGSSSHWLCTDFVRLSHAGMQRYCNSACKAIHKHTHKQTHTHIYVYISMHAYVLTYVYVCLTVFTYRLI